MQGHRVEFRPGFPGRYAQPGDYCKVPDGVDPRGNGWWYIVDPTGGAGALDPAIHTITEHEDGTVSVTPSIVAPLGWHGFLNHGVWS
jgi:hypothetical protein